MPFILLLLGALLAVAAFNDSAGTLATELETDVPSFMRWGIAVFAVGALGWIPGMEKISRYLLALVVVVIVLSQWQNILNGFSTFAKNFAGGASGTVSQAAVTPATAYAANPNNPQITPSEISGTGQVSGSTASSGNINAAGNQVAAAPAPFGAFDPGAFLTAFELGVGGFGGIV